MQQARRLLAVIEGHRLSALFSTALVLGLRRGEVLGLSWPDLDFNAGSVSVRHSLQRLDGSLQLVPPQDASIGESARCAARTYEDAGEAPSPAAGRAPCSWVGLAGAGPGLHIDGRNATRTTQREPCLGRGPSRSRSAEPSIPRSPSLLRHDPHGAGCASESDHGDAPSLSDRRHDEHLLPRLTSPPKRGCGRLGDRSLPLSRPPWLHSWLHGHRRPASRRKKGQVRRVRHQGLEPRTR